MLAHGGRLPAAGSRVVGRALGPGCVGREVPGAAFARPMKNPRSGEPQGANRDCSGRGRARPPAGESSAVRAIRRALDRARTLERAAYAPVRAEALFQQGRLLSYRGARAEVQAGRALLLEAVDVATGARHDELAAEALAFLVLDAYHHGDTAKRGQELLERAFAASRRIGDRPRDRAKLMRRQGMLLARQVAYSEAERRQREALALLAEDQDTPWLFRPVHLHDLGNTVRDQKRYPEAQALYNEARALFLARLSREHPYVAALDFDIAVLAHRQGELERARALYEDVLRVRMGGLGEVHPDVGAVYFALANIDQEQGVLDRAESSAAAGLRIYEQVFDEHDPRLADAYQVIGALRHRRADYEGARAAYERALAGLIARLGRDHAAVGQAQANLAEAELALLEKAGDGGQANADAIREWLGPARSGQLRP